MTDALETIESEGKRILDLGREDLDRPVPQYPDWKMGGLLAHTGGILGRTSLICRDLLTERPHSPRPGEDDDVADWFEERLNEVLSVFGESDPTAPVWGFGPDPNVGMWINRMLIEVGVHRWDAEQAFGEPAPLLDEVAEAGLDEFGTMWFPRLGELDALALTATDLGRHWHYGKGEPAGAIEGPASEIYLRLMSRPSTVVLPDDWAAAVDSLEPPPR
ncbi:MAG: maleylpyruvate isomerase family mycothiol-dependent enzyme [Acidimicrobiia bacterium]